MRILVVEDDALVAKTLELLFADHNYAIDVTTNGETAWQMAEAFEYDLLLLDVLLPGLDGISLCQKLRDNDYQMPILLLTGQDDSHQKAVALNVGADDYVVKPFDPEELVARVQALLRRGSSVAQPVMEWGNLHLEPSIRRVTYETHLLTLTPKEYAILELFLRNSQRTLSPKTILGHAWNSIDNPGEETVRAHIKGLRQKLKAVGAPGDLIETVYGVGYRLKPLQSITSPTQAEVSPRSSTVAEAPEAGLSNQRSPQITQSTVMVVTGDAGLFNQIQALLVSKPLKLIALDQADQFWQKLEKYLPDCLILDLEMPGISSLKLCQTLRQKPHWENLPILFVIPSIQTDLVNQVFAAGANDFVCQPIVGPELIARLLSRPAC